MSELSADQWLNVAAVSFCKVAATSLSMAGKVEARCPTGLQGAFVPLVGTNDSVQIGITADRPTCQVLARRMLQMEDHEVPSDHEVRDALGEIANMVAGMSKASRPDKNRDLALGLPILFEGVVNTTDATSIQSIQVDLAGTPVAVTVIHSK